MMSKDAARRPKASQLIDEYFDGQRICQMSESTGLSLDQLTHKQETTNYQGKERD